LIETYLGAPGGVALPKYDKAAFGEARSKPKECPAIDRAGGREALQKG
jgi:hypothetical protein